MPSSSSLVIRLLFQMQNVVMTLERNVTLVKNGSMGISRSTQ